MQDKSHQRDIDATRGRKDASVLSYDVIAYFFFFFVYKNFFLFCLYIFDIFIIIKFQFEEYFDFLKNGQYRAKTDMHIVYILLGKY